MNQQGEVVAEAAGAYPQLHPASGFSEQNPQEWIDACEGVFSQLSSDVSDFTDELVGISFSGQMHSLVVLNEKKQVLRNAILWNDVRTTEECQTIMSEFGDKIVAITKNRALEGFTLPKILWLQTHEPELWQQVRHLLLPKDYLGYYLTGTLHMDYSDAAGTLLLDMDNDTWSEAITQRFNIPINLLPQLIPSTGKTGFLRPELMQKFKFKQAISIFAGAADNACAALGAGILDESKALVSIGTSGVFLAMEPIVKQYNGTLHLFHHAATDRYYSMGVTLAAGDSLQWFRKNFAPNQTLDELLCRLSSIPAGSNGLLFTPYIAGERTPYADSAVRGSFVGMSAAHTPDHFARAVLEGITFSLKDSQQLIETSSGKSFKRIVAVGGGAKNKDWLQLQADIFDAEIVTLETEQGPGVGAAMLAAIGMGWFDSFESCAEIFVRYQKALQPIPEQTAVYQSVYQIYQQMYAATAAICHQLKQL